MIIWLIQLAYPWCAIKISFNLLNDLVRENYLCWRLKYLIEKYANNLYKSILNIAHQIFRSLILSQKNNNLLFNFNEFFISWNFPPQHKYEDFKNRWFFFGFDWKIGSSKMRVYVNGIFIHFLLIKFPRKFIWNENYWEIWFIGINIVNICTLSVQNTWIKAHKTPVVSN